MRFRAAVLDRVGAPLKVDTLEMAAPQAGDVLVRLRASGLCQTDLEVMQGSLAYPLPLDGTTRARMVTNTARACLMADPAWTGSEFSAARDAQFLNDIVREFLHA